MPNSNPRAALLVMAHPIAVEYGGDHVGNLKDAIAELLDAALKQAREEQRKADAEIARSTYPEVCACGTVIAAAILRGREGEQ